METRFPSSIQVPHRDNISAKEGLVTQPWIEFFRAIKNFIDARTSEFLAATSSNFPLTTSGYASGEWAQMTGNKVTLTPGEWIIYGQIYASVVSSPATFNALYCQWSTINGNNTSSDPITLITQAGLSKGVSTYNGVSVLGSSGYLAINAPTVRVMVTKSTDIFLVPKAVFSSAGDGYVKTYIHAERVKTIPGRAA